MTDITLARVRRADAADLIAANQANRAYHLPWVDPFVDQAGFDGWFADAMTGAQVSLIGREMRGGRIVGVFNISQIFMRGFQSAYIGFYGMAGTGGRGLMTQALNQAVDYGFSEIGLHRIEANVQPGNTRSLGLVERAGFKREGSSPRYLRIGGVWCDHERWAKLVDEP